MAVPLVLKVFKGEELLSTQEFQRDVIKIGRLQSAHLRLTDERVSRIHSVIEVAASGDVSIIDMGSAEGTFVNGARVNRGKLKSGDEVVLGGTRIVVDLSGTAVAAAPEPVAVPAAAPVAVPVAAAVAPPPPLPPPAPVAAYRAPVPEHWDQPPQQDITRAYYTQEVAAEVLEFWQDTLLSSYQVHLGDDLYVGSTPRSRIFVPADFLAAQDFHILTADPAGFAVHFTDRMTGFCEHNGQRVSLKDLIAHRQAVMHAEVPGAYRFVLAPGASGRVEIGPLAVEVRPALRPRPAKRALLERMDLRFANLLLLMFFLFGGAAVTVHNTPLDLTAEQQDEFYKSQNRWTKVALRPPDKKQQELIERLKKVGQKGDPGQAAAKAAGKEGQMGKKNAPQANARSAPKAIRPSDKEIVANSGVLKALGKLSGGLSTVFGGSGLGGDLQGKLGHLTGARVGDAGGIGGLGLKGTGEGGGGTSMTTFGIGGPGTKGRGGGSGTYGTGVGGLGGKGDAAISVDAGDPVVMGSLDKELIRQVIHSHRSQIQYCYEKELNTNPNLAGKIMTYFVITGQGTVSMARVQETTMKNRAVEDCLVGRVKSWQFPKPKGGGIVVVTYPFIFKPAG